MIKNYVYETRELLYLPGSMIDVLWLAFDYLVVAELAYDSRMFRKLFMDEGEFRRTCVEMLDTPLKEVVLFNCVRGHVE